ncbi:multiheme c-type cytochrome [Pseudophaeobacter sp. EL27]|uniref:multiheme c-type cytochrome n=1 Tax=Pseudophaeobacter sp. EL27 TaxID=2107580 RepID=UPI0020B1330E|nr:multiheme c-type cytochrome [Pseudophaeobacter sp. EL27]
MTLRFNRLARVAALLMCFAVPVIAQSDLHPQYVGSEACTDCHEEAAEAWAGSHHAKAWTKTTDANVLGDFSGTTFTQNGIMSRFYRDGETYMIETDGPDGRMARYPVHSVVGVEPLQQYLLETEEGRLQSFDVVWDIEEEKWYHLYPDQELYGGDGLHWTGPYKNWNARCAECHATDFNKNYTPTKRSYASTQAEIGVGCEACHGPGEAHLAWAGKLETSQIPWTGLSNTGLTITMSQGGEVMLQQCASCHARREPFEDGNPLPGTPFHNAYRLSTLRDGSYHADGQILDEVYVYGSFLQSKMYAQGVTCGNCHEPHSAELIVEGNGLCTQCHSEAGNADFPTLALQSYDDPSHHFHPVGSEGAQCKSCHMIERDYMVVDGRRDHSFRIPRPDQSLETRSPNACTDCHSDQTAKWAAEAIAKWYPDSAHRGPHFGQTLAVGRRDLTGSTDELVALAEYAVLPGIARATALEMLTRVASPELAARLAPLLEDPDPIVRAAAVGLQRGAPETERPAVLAAMLEDPAKTVRIAAAREFLSLRIARMPDRISRALNGAMRDWQGSLLAKADFPETQVVMAGIGLTTRRMGAALQAFGEAVTLDPQLEQGWVMMIRIHDAMGNRDDARETVDRAIEANPDSIQLALIRAELQL